MSQMPTGAQASTSGFFTNALNNFVTVGSSLIDLRIAKENAKAAASQPAPSSTTGLQTQAQGGTDWKATVVPSSTPAWMPAAIIGGIVLIVGGIVLAMMRKR